MDKDIIFESKKKINNTPNLFRLVALGFTLQSQKEIPTTGNNKKSTQKDILQILVFMWSFYVYVILKELTVCFHDHGTNMYIHIYFLKIIINNSIRFKEKQKGEK